MIKKEMTLSKDRNIAQYSNGEFAKYGYPHRFCDEKVKGLAKGIEFYNIIDNPIDNPNESKYIIKKLPLERTEIKDEEFPHMFKAVQNYELVEHSTEEVIERLEASLFNHIDRLLPLSIRIECLSRYSYLQQLEAAGGEYWSKNLALEKKWLEDVDTWYNTLKADCENRKNKLLTNGTIPSLDWDDMPIKTF